MSEPAVPRDAATVLLLRDVPAGVEVYLLRRVKGMPFAGGMTAYPGGSVDPRDADADIGWVGPPTAAWAESFGCSESLARALVCAAVRETFEEAGVLLAAPDYDDDGAVVVADDADWEAERQALLRREHSLAELLTRRGLRLRADLLRPWAHWITPADEPRRYDTRFFAAALPAGVQPRDISGEADEAVWVAPAAALAQNKSGTRPMLAPTLYTLRDIVGHARVADVLAAAPPGRLDTVQPRLEYDADGEFVVMPDG
ncbi:MAG: NUDIX hydrolase, partial [Geodermatophilaceae bacterium]|nr:NUDIX hydrolase [Geodermatophilaceae bacterium]